MEHPCWVKIAQNLSNTPLHISIHYHSAPVVAMRSLSVSGCETIENLPLSASYHHHTSWLESWCSSLSSYSKWSHDFKEICITHTHFLTHRIPSHFLLGFLPRSKIWCQDLQLPWLQKIRSQNLPCSTQLAQLVQLLKDCLNTFGLLGWPNSTTVPFVSLSSRLCLHLRSKTNKTNAGAH